MNKDEKVGVTLPERSMPYIFDGFEQPRVIKTVYVTLDGYFPRMRDITTIFGKSRRDVEARRIKRTSKKFDRWYAISNPTIDDVVKAINNVNKLYRWRHNLEDNCSLCNSLDDELFKEKCWLVSTTHICGNINQNYSKIEMTYSYKGLDYTVNMYDWLKKGVRLHLQDNLSQDNLSQENTAHE